MIDLEHGHEIRRFSFDQICQLMKRTAFGVRIAGEHITNRWKVASEGTLSAQHIPEIIGKQFHDTRFDLGR